MRVLDRGHDLLGAFEAVAARRAHVQLDDADVGGREEIGADHRHQRAGDRDQEPTQAPSTNFAAQQHGFQRAAIGVAEAIEAAIEGTRQTSAQPRTYRPASW